MSSNSKQEKREPPTTRESSTTSIRLPSRVSRRLTPTYTGSHAETSEGLWSTALSPHAWEDLTPEDITSWTENSSSLRTPFLGNRVYSTPSAPGRVTVRSCGSPTEQETTEKHLSPRCLWPIEEHYSSLGRPVISNAPWQHTSSDPPLTSLYSTSPEAKKNSSATKPSKRSRTEYSSQENTNPECVYFEVLSYSSSQTSTQTDQNSQETDGTYEQSDTDQMEESSTGASSDWNSDDWDPLP